MLFSFELPSEIEKKKERAKAKENLELEKRVIYKQLYEFESYFI